MALLGGALAFIATNASLVAAGVMLGGGAVLTLTVLDAMDKGR